MDTDPNLLLPVLTLRMLGGESIPKTDPIVKAVKAQLFTNAKQKGLIVLKSPQIGKLRLFLV